MASGDVWRCELTASRTVLFVGGPNAGKSNLLIRLWLAIRSSTSNVISKRGLPIDLNYLQEGAQTQLTGSFVDHTSAPPEVQPSIPIYFKGAPAELVMPDRPGEDWDRLYRDRRWPEEWLNYLDQSTSCLIVMRALPPQGQTRDWIALQYFMGPRANFNLEEDRTEDPAPLQVMLVDWIQIIVRLYQRRFGSSAKPRIGVVITAWDEVEEEQRELGPMEFLKNEYKLLHDYLISNHASLNSKVFAVSIFGGDLANPDYSKQVTDSEDPVQLGWVSSCRDGSVLTSNELLTPVIWALEATGDD